MKYTIQELKDKNLIIGEFIMGSHAYGTSLPTSDVDLRGIFIQPLEDILGYGYVEQVADEKNDIVYYEIQRFLQLLQTNNPTVLEMLSVPEDCVRFKDPIYDLIIEHKKEFITKQCKNSFAGYAIQQIKKARGYNKKINWEETEMVRKTVLDFCYVLEDGGSKPFNEWVKSYPGNCDYKDFGLANVDHAHNLYALYFGEYHSLLGIVSDPEKANDVQLSSIPKEYQLTGYLTFNKDSYSLHCKKYAEYLLWLENRNEDRFKMNKDHGKNYDSKNLMHCVRILNMANEILTNGEINVRRSSEEIKVLMSIRRGEMEYDDLLEQAESKIKQLDENFEISTLPDKVDKEMVNQLLIKIRKLRYGL